MLPGNVSHGCALSQNISIVGLSQDVSSNVPALMMLRPGKAGATEIIGEPHSGQKMRFTGWPLLALSLYVFVFPWIVSADSGTATTMEKALPACFWQFLQ